MKDSADSRRLIFISHANPEDNDFTLWLVGRLASHGYLVWSDLTKLIGAEVFWNDIEDAIRNHAAKVVVVLSRDSQQKEGVLDEVNLAVTVERSQKLKEFVVPVRIDDLAFSDVKPNLARKNIIDFRAAWRDGLHALLEVLERDTVPRKLADSVGETNRWFSHVIEGDQQIRRGPQTLLSNWIQIDEYPETLHFFRIPIKQEKAFKQFKDFSYPVYPYADMVATFANVDELNSGMPNHMQATKAHDVPVQAVLDGEYHPLSQRLGWNEAANLLSYILSGAWDRAMARKGLLAYELSSGKQAWFPLNNDGDGNWTSFVDVTDVQRRKRLVGYSPKRRVYWHFAVEAIPSIGRYITLTLKPHVVFSEDGITPLSSSSRLHSLRRGFCRNWWNERWRGLMIAFTAMIADKDGQLSLVVGDEQEFRVNPRPMAFEAPVYLSGITEEAVDVDQTDNQLDDLDEGDDQTFEVEEVDSEVEEEIAEGTTELADSP